jgi:DNA-binding transcriptional regulator YiaG
MDQVDIKNLRCSLQLSQAKFAEIIGVSRDAVSQWERGLRNPSDLSISKIKNIIEMHATKKRKSGLYG